MTTFTRSIPCGMEIELKPDDLNIILFGAGEDQYDFSDNGWSPREIENFFNVCQFIFNQTWLEGDVARGQVFVAIAQFLSDHEKDIVG